MAMTRTTLPASPPVAKRPPATRARRRTAAAGATRRAAPAKPMSPTAGWGTLDGGASAPSARKKTSTLDGVPTRRVALLILAAAAACTLYVGHVHATQDLAAELQVERRENLRLHLKENRLRGAFDAVTGPAAVVERAQALGLEEGVAYGPTIHVP